MRVLDEEWEVTMRRMRGKVNRGTKLISLWPWTYYIGDRQWMFAQRIANSDAGIWPRKARQGPFAQQRGTGSGHGMVNQLNQLIYTWTTKTNESVCDISIVNIWYNSINPVIGRI